MHPFASRRLPACLIANALVFLSVAAAMTNTTAWNLRFLEIGVLLLLANAVVVLVLGAILIFPALVDSPADEKKLENLLARHPSVPHGTRRSVLFSIREDVERLRRRASTGRMTLLTGAMFLIVAFGSATATITRVQPADSILSTTRGPVPNRAVTTEEAWRFTGDQVSGALFLDIPELYQWYLTDLVNNTKAPAFTTFTFGFRAVLGWVSLAVMLTLARSLRLRRKAPETQNREAANAAHPAAAATASGFEVASRSMAE